VTQNANNSVAVVDTATHVIIATIPVGILPVRIAITPVPTIDGLIRQVAGLTLNSGQINSLLSKLAAVQASLARGNTTAALNELSAFINEIHALELSGRLDSETASSLVNAAQAIKDTISSASF
jgi:YVTN family beta-propeller protein